MTDNDFSPYLLSGERVKWSGRPRQGIVFSAIDIFMVPFSLLWGGFAIFWEASVLVIKRAPLVFQLWGIPFVLMGLYMIAGRFFVDAWVRRNTIYGLTDKRVLIVRSVPLAKVTALNLASLPSVHLSERSGGRGSITFGEDSLWWRGFPGWNPALTSTPAFTGIENAGEVFARLQALTQQQAG